MMFGNNRLVPFNTEPNMYKDTKVVFSKVGRKKIKNKDSQDFVTSIVVYTIKDLTVDPQLREQIYFEEKQSKCQSLEYA